MISERSALADEMDADAADLESDCSCPTCRRRAGRLRAAARLLRTTPPPATDCPVPGVECHRYVADLRAERDTLRAEVERYRAAIAAHEDCCLTDLWPELREAAAVTTPTTNPHTNGDEP